MQKLGVFKELHLGSPFPPRCASGASSSPFLRSVAVKNLCEAGKEREGKLTLWDYSKSGHFVSTIIKYALSRE